METYNQGFPGGSDGKESACDAGDPGSIPGSGVFPGEGNGYPLQYSCLGNPMDRGSQQAIGEGNGTPFQYSCLENPMDGGAQQAAVHGVTEGRTRLSGFTFTFHFHALEKEMATHSSVLA